MCGDDNPKAGALVRISTEGLTGMAKGTVAVVVGLCSGHLVVVKDGVMVALQRGEYSPVDQEPAKVA